MPPPDDRSALRDIEHAAGLILGLISDLNFELYAEDWVVRSAIERQLSVIGEAVKRLSREFREGEPDVDWRGWAGFRDILVHAYDAVEPAIVWEVVQNELQALYETALKRLDGD